jgi:hypothetical protein
MADHSCVFHQGAPDHDIDKLTACIEKRDNWGQLSS